MIKKAFKDEWWNSQDICSVDGTTRYMHMAEKHNPRDFYVNLGKALIKKFTKNMKLGPNDFTQMEYNFPLFFGLAVQLYQATLVADDTPYDRYVGSPLNVRGDGNPIPADLTALTEQEQKGLALFGTDPANNPGLGCVLCHALPETTEHTIRTLQVDNQGIPVMVRYLPDGDGGGFGPPNTLPQAYIDFGMRNLAHRPNQDDIGRGGTAPNPPPPETPTNEPLPLSYVELAKLKKVGKLPADVAFLCAGPVDCASGYTHSRHPAAGGRQVGYQGRL